jgi:hypothetical protein
VFFALARSNITTSTIIHLGDISAVCIGLASFGLASCGRLIELSNSLMCKLPRLLRSKRLVQ